jgi:hypothetical protein
MMANIFAVQEHQGTWVSQSANVNRSGMWKVQFVSIPTVQYEDPSYSLDYSLEISQDNGLTWTPWYRVTWQGGPAVGRDGTVNPPPWLLVDLTPAVGYRGRIVGIVPKAMTFGIDFTRQ